MALAHNNDDFLRLDKAEALLPEIRPLLEEARRIKHEIEAICASYDYDSVLLEKEKTRLAPKMQRLSENLDKLENLHCYIKDLDIGLIDFLTTFEGRDVFLCWKLGEPHIMHWHELNEGFSSRQEILDMAQLSLDWNFS